MTTRREFIAGASAAAAVAVVGAPPIAAPSVQAATVTPLPAWDVGSGEMDWRVIFAETAEDAKKIWYQDAHDEDPDAPCACGCGEVTAYCKKYGVGLPEARRAKHWDNPNNEEPSWTECYEHGWQTTCTRCGNEVSRDDGESDVIAGEVMCHDCMTDDELRSVCPDHHRFDENV